MELLLIGIYVSICIVIFKLFRIPVNQWSLSTAALGGIAGIAILLLTMNYNHPFTTNARIYFPLTPILPTVKGRVIEVPVKTNTPLKEGDVLFRIDPKPYQYAVDQKKAALAEAEQKVDELKASLDQATAAAGRADAQVQLAQQNYDRQKYLFEHKVSAQAVLDTATRNLEAAKQTLSAAQAEQERARLAYTANVGGENVTVAQRRAELEDAQFDLDQTTIRAGGPGFVTQVSLRPGMYVIPTQFGTAMTFVNTGKGNQWLAAAFDQNAMQRINEGDDAGVAFDGIPGRVFKGKVSVVVPAIAAGQLPASPRLIEPETRTTRGRLVADIDVTEDLSDYKLPLGAAAQVAIYTEHWHELSLLRKILLRMRSWQNYIFLEGHGGGGGGGESGGH
jgi:multidrug resistance efflux pump